jgi:rhodanese-related sulfurtransferase
LINYDNKEPDMITEISSKEAWVMLREDQSAILVDVRSHAEWLLVGVPVLDSLGKKIICIEWQDSNGNRNPAFLDELQSHIQPDQSLLMMCRSGKRSLMAALAITEAMGQDSLTVINISDGFEGDLNDQKQRKSVNGWCYSGLPWMQG